MRNILNSPRVRFNWGYHDGASDVLMGRSMKHINGHFDKIYLKGYDYGWEDARNGDYNENSDAAWESRLSSKRPPWMPDRKRR